MTVFESVFLAIRQANRELKRSHLNDAKITIELTPDDWVAFKHSMEPMFWPSYSNMAKEEIEIYGHKVKAYYPKG